ncbi:MAG: 16S rRNA (cytosine(1402)-N(4))-methyltransferase RsmH [Pseudomonadota bacterium]|nr:16S rRNA (cytosine(1402)-N(4))-methyltransferase RsmH [Pseudomonadota bacterium]
MSEVVKLLVLHDAGLYIDCTFGRGGHARAILQRLGRRGRLVVIDRDPAAVSAAEQLAGEDPRVEVARSSFALLEQLAHAAAIAGQVDGILFDLGVSSAQLDDSRRGFSCGHDGPLDMRMDNESGFTAAQWIATVSTRELTEVIRAYGEERFATRIARAIVREQALAPITTTKRLAEIVARAKPVWEKNLHPATRCFQALRIIINDELDELKLGLRQAVKVLRSGGRLVVISFHSLEDRIVKRFIRDESQGRSAPRSLPPRVAAEGLTLKQVCGPMKPTVGEIARNPRARSATLRVAEKLL